MAVADILWSFCNGTLYTRNNNTYSPSKFIVLDSLNSPKLSYTGLTDNDDWKFGNNIILVYNIGMDNVGNSITSVYKRILCTRRGALPILYKGVKYFAGPGMFFDEHLNPLILSEINYENRHVHKVIFDRSIWSERTDALSNSLKKTALPNIASHLPVEIKDISSMIHNNVDTDYSSENMNAFLNSHFDDFIDKSVYLNSHIVRGEVDLNS